MSAQAKHLEFAPPPPEGTARSVGAALVVHALLIVALTAGIQWKQDNSLSVEAELWSAVPMAAAPKLVEVEAPPPPPAPKPEPAPKPVVKAPEPPAPNRDADIALAKKRKIERFTSDHGACNKIHHVKTYAGCLSNCQAAPFQPLIWSTKSHYWHVSYD